jgi:hypothetical protein
MTPTGWVEAILTVSVIPIAAKLLPQLQLRDIMIMLPASAAILYFSIDINIIALVTSSILIALSAYRLHILLHKTPKGPVNPTPHSDGVG